MNLQSGGGIDTGTAPLFSNVSSGAEMVKPALLLLSLDYAPNDGGISRLALGATMGLQRAALPLSIVTAEAQGRSGLPRPAVAIQEVSRRKGLRDWQILRAVRAHLRAHGRAAPVLTTLWNPEATLAILGGARRVSILAHGNEVMAYGGLKGRLRRFVLERAHRVICNSRFTERLVLAIAPKARTAVLNPGVDAEAFRQVQTRAEAQSRLGFSQAARILLTVSRLDPVKGHETVLRALAELTTSEREGMVYVVVGKGEMRAPLEAMSRDLGIAEHVHFTGFVADADLPLWYAAADLFLLCSVMDRTRRGMEGFGMALTEAQAAGLPVIGTRSGGIEDAVCEGEGGWLIAERDVVALAEHLRRLSGNPAEFAEQGQRGAARVRREMDWDSYTRRLMDLI